MDVSIIIINYNTYNLIIDCIHSIILNTKGINYEIIVVDNNSPNRDIENLNSLFPKVKLILHNKNAGFGAGNNVGFENSLGRYLFFLNSDTILLNNAVDEMFNFMENTPTAGICGGNLFNSKLQPTLSFETFKPGVFLYSVNFLTDFYYRKIFKKTINFVCGSNPKKIRGYICGADFFINKATFEKVGKFDENFFMYYEEVDLTVRVNKLGLYSYIVPQAQIVHLEGGSQLDIEGMKLKWMQESRKYYFKKNKLCGLNIVNFEIKTFKMISKFF